MALAAWKAPAVANHASSVETKTSIAEGRNHDVTIFIRRPVFAWVIAIFIIIFGLLSIPKLPIARFPSVAPPQVNISATYPGATAKTINDSVVTLIERELSGVKIYSTIVRQQIPPVQQRLPLRLNRAQMWKWLRSTFKIKSRL